MPGCFMTEEEHKEAYGMWLADIIVEILLIAWFPFLLCLVGGMIYTWLK